MATFEFVFSEDFLIEAFRRHRQTKATVRYGRILKLFLGACLVGVMVFLAVAAKTLLGASIVLAVLAALIFSPYLDEILIRRRFRKSPYWNDKLTVTLSAEGISSRGSKGGTQLTWDAITSGRKFDDGFLLFQGPGVSNWLPAKAMTEGTIREVEDLVGKHVVDWSA